jgi:type VI secretion system protein VasG
VIKLITSRCNEVDSGGRIIDSILTNTILPKLSAEYLRRISEGLNFGGVKMSVKDADFAYEFLD